MISTTEDGIQLFSDCFNKFGISLLLLNDEEKFNRIVDILVENRIPLQKSNGIYNLRIFAVDLLELENIINEYKSINEVEFLKHYPERITEAKNIHTIFENMKNYQKNGVSYKNENEYNIALLLDNNTYFVEDNNTSEFSNINDYLKSILSDASLVDKVINHTSNKDEEDFDVALELQKVENKICEEYLYPVDDGWKIVIDNKEVNGFQNIKDTINLITELNIPITFDDAFLFVLFYKTTLSVSEVDDIVKNVLKKGEM
jgi:cell fate (sporulation/competence/biofilm development) regulator YmcA (YheA/YmcA/DUF963 family)